MYEAVGTMYTLSLFPIYPFTEGVLFRRGRVARVKKLLSMGNANELFRDASLIYPDRD